MELKTFTHIEDEGTEWEWEETLVVLYDPGLEKKFAHSANYVVNANEPHAAFTIFPDDIPHYIEILEWMRDHQASLPQTDRTDGGEEIPHVDSPGAREEEG